MYEAMSERVIVLRCVRVLDVNAWTYLWKTCGKPVENPSAKRTTVLSEPCRSKGSSLISGAIRIRISLDLMYRYPWSRISFS